MGENIEILTESAFSHFVDFASLPEGLWDLYNQPVPLKGDLAVRADTWWAIELCAYDNVPEWDGQRVVFRQEEDAAVYDGGNEWVLWRQEAMWLVQP